MDELIHQDPLPEKPAAWLGGWLAMQDGTSSSAKKEKQSSTPKSPKSQPKAAVMSTKKVPESPSPFLADVARKVSLDKDKKTKPSDSKKTPTKKDSAKKKSPAKTEKKSDDKKASKPSAKSGKSKK